MVFVMLPMHLLSFYMSFLHPIDECFNLAWISTYNVCRGI